MCYFYYPKDYGWTVNRMKMINIANERPVGVLFPKLICFGMLQINLRDPTGSHAKLNIALVDNSLQLKRTDVGTVNDFQTYLVSWWLVCAHQFVYSPTRIWNIRYIDAGPVQEYIVYFGLYKLSWPWEYSSFFHDDWTTGLITDYRSMLYIFYDLPVSAAMLN